MGRTWSRPTTQWWNCIPTSPSRAARPSSMACCPPSTRSTRPWRSRKVGADGSEPACIHLPTIIDGMLPTEHQEHETLEITHGWSEWFETGLYQFTDHQPGGGWMWVRMQF